MHVSVVSFLLCVLCRVARAAEVVVHCAFEVCRVLHLFGCAQLCMFVLVLFRCACYVELRAAEVVGSYFTESWFPAPETQILFSRPPPLCSCVPCASTLCGTAPCCVYLTLCSGGLHPPCYISVRLVGVGTEGEYLGGGQITTGARNLSQLKTNHSPLPMSLTLESLWEE